MIVDLFSGGGAGWCLGARALGMASIGIEWGGPECATRAAVGLATIRADVAQYPPERFAGKVEGLCGSPPCQAFYSAKPRVADPATDPATDPAPTIALGHNAAAWCWERPATTVMGDQRVFPPGGHHPGNGTDPKSWSSNAIPVEPWELGVLQGFPADHPWQPPHVSRQIGNAFPPPFAEACLRAISGVERLECVA